MTVKNEAKKLVEKFTNIEIDGNTFETGDPWINESLAVDCALVCVKEILHVLNKTVNAQENFYNQIKIELENYDRI